MVMPMTLTIQWILGFEVHAKKASLSATNYLHSTRLTEYEKADGGPETSE